MKNTVLEYFIFVSKSGKTLKSLETIPAPEQIKIDGKLYKKFDLYQELTFGQKIALTQEKYANDLIAVKKILSIIYQPLILNCKFDPDKAIDCEAIIEKCSIFEAYPLCFDYIRQLQEINERETKEWKFPVESDAHLCGIDDLQRFGIFGTIDDLAGGDILKHDRILNQPYHIVFFKIARDAAKARFEKRYRDFLREKNK